jgi:predicted PP-loop superfamily ATPase
LVAYSSANIRLDHKGSFPGEGGDDVKPAAAVAVAGGVNANASRL